MKKTEVVQPTAMTTPFAEGVYSSTGTTNFEIPAATSTSENDTCVQDDGFLPITSTDLDDGGIAPERKNFNGLFYLSTDQRCYLQNGGFITYNSAVATAIGGYPQDAVLDYISGLSFRKVISLIDDNTYDFVSNPSYIDGVHWAYLNLETNGANKDLSNLSATGQTVLDSKLNKSMISDCILASPNGIIDTYLNSISFTIKAGLKVLIPNGLNADGTYNNTEYTLPADTAVSVASTADGMYGINLYSNGTVALYSLNNMVYSSTAPSFAPSMLWYNQFTNYYKYTVDSGVNWTSIALTCIGYISVISGKVNFWHPKRPFVSLDASSMCFIAPANGNKTASINNFPIVQNNYVNGGSGCRIWTDGFKEQWGSAVGTGTSIMQGVGFLQNFRDTNYSVVATITDMDSGYSNIIKIVAIGAKAINGFSFATAYPTAYAAFTINWYACGY